MLYDGQHKPGAGDTLCPSRWNAGTGRRGGFTLVELLVVLAIMALLASMLVPALGRAREQTRMTLCASRMRAVGVGTLFYAADQGSYLPVEDALDNPQRELIDRLRASHCVVDERNYYCPAARESDLCCTPENLESGCISYFYFCCTRATSNRRVSTFLRWEVAWPRLLRDQMSGQTWVCSDAWFSGEPTAHRYPGKGINYFTLGGTVQRIADSPRRGFK